MNVYLDESGDLGWSLALPYQAGGSSRFLTIAFLIIPKHISQKTKRIVKALYKRRKRSTKKEIKGYELEKHEKLWFADRVSDFTKRNPEASISAITVRKSNVQSHIIADPNKLYNYMIGLTLLEKIQAYPVIDFIPDPRSIKVKSGNSLADYLQIKLWFEYNTATTIKCVPHESKNNLNLQFIDWVAHIIWSRYELNESAPFNILKHRIELRPLFF
jgi:hypothetical protein